MGRAGGFGRDVALASRRGGAVKKHYSTIGGYWIFDISRGHPSAPSYFLRNVTLWLETLGKRGEARPLNG